ncbi:DUF6491 family protein [Novilysobacter erysipheiresistens]|uniref:DUF6491 family protein n=1 Tax=Novilysobacter erysipheiresistens TaxID=1749332 RepID=A0ABU7YUJ3_9GAMM
MKTFVLAIAAALVLGACATGPRLPDDQRTQIYREAAGAPVGNFHYFGTLDGWKSISDTALVVWVRARDGYLLTLSASCPQLDFAHAISVDDRNGRVYVGDSVRVLGEGPTFPCQIAEIQPLDRDAARRAEAQADAAALQVSGGT